MEDGKQTKGGGAAAVIGGGKPIIRRWEGVDEHKDISLLDGKTSAPNPINKHSHSSLHLLCREQLLILNFVCLLCLSSPLSGQTIPDNLVFHYGLPLHSQRSVAAGSEWAMAPWYSGERGGAGGLYFIILVGNLARQSLVPLQVCVTCI